MHDKIDSVKAGSEPDPAPIEAPFPTDEEITKAGWVKSSKRERIVTSVPRVGQAYWVDFPRDAYVPEFVGEHPGIVVRAARKLHDTCVVIPMSTRDQGSVKHTHKLKTNPNPKSREKGIVSYAVCDHLYTINIARLRPFSFKGRNVYPRVEVDDLKEIYRHLREAIPHALSQPAEAKAAEQVVAAQSLDKPKRPDGPNTLHLKPAAGVKAGNQK